MMPKGALDRFCCVIFRFDVLHSDEVVDRLNRHVRAVRTNTLLGKSIDGETESVDRDAEVIAVEHPSW